MLQTPLDTNRSVHEPLVIGVSPRLTDRRRRQELRNTRVLWPADDAVVERFTDYDHLRCGIDVGVGANLGGALPGPTPMVGVPELYASFTMLLPPVARMRRHVWVAHETCRSSAIAAEGELDEVGRCAVRARA